VEAEVVVALLQRLKVYVLVVAAKRLRGHQLRTCLSSLCILHGLLLLDGVRKGDSRASCGANQERWGCVYTSHFVSEGVGKA
jgi:hypothetical protein